MTEVCGVSIAEYTKVARSLVTPGTLRGYGTYWNEMDEQFGDRDLASIRPTELQAVVAGMSDRGKSAQEHYVAAARCLWAFAVKDDLVTNNPALKVAKPTRSESNRRSLTNEELDDLWKVARFTGSDPDLDTLLIRFHLETGGRRGGAINALISKMDTEQQIVLLKEKARKDRWQPISKSLLDALELHIASRGGSSTSSLFRYQDGSPLTRKRYETLFGRLKSRHSWAKSLGVSAHWLRHTAITMVEQTSSYAIAQKFAGHAGRTPTDTYVTVTLSDVARAVEIITGEEHPMATKARPSPFGEFKIPNF